MTAANYISHFQKDFWQFCLVIFTLVLLTACNVKESTNLEAGWVVRHGLSSEEYQSQFNFWTKKGFKLTYISGHQLHQNAHYNVVFQKQSSGPWEAYHGMNADQYQSTVDTMKARGYQPKFVDAFNLMGEPSFSVIFEIPQHNWVAEHGLSPQAYEKAHALYKKSGYRLIHISGYQDNKQPLYAAIWERSFGPKRVDHIGLNGQQFQAKFDQLAKQGFQPIVISAYFVGTTPNFAAIWEKQNTRWNAKFAVEDEAFQLTINDYYYEGYRPVVIDAYSRGPIVRYATMWINVSWDISALDKLNADIEKFRTDNKIPGLSIAVSKDEKLVYAKGFGEADQEAHQDVNTSHRFRMASLAKSLTAAATTKLIQEGKLELDDTVFGPNSVLGNDFGSSSDLVQTVEVQDLLEHTVGGWCDGTIIFSTSKLSWSRDQLIEDALKNKPLTQAPGTSFCYSNFAYLVLEVVIEKISGLSYHDYIMLYLAAPAKAQSLAIGGNTLAQQLSNEVKYYDDDENPYFWNLSRMAGHGGWVVSPVDFLKIQTLLDGFSHRKDILNAEGIDIFSRDDRVVSDDAWNSTNAYYAKGITVNNNNTWRHNGNIPGTIAEYARFDNGVSIVAVINTREVTLDNGALSTPILRDLVNQIFNANVNWPSHDLF